MNNIATENLYENEHREISGSSKSNFLYSFSFLSKEKNDAINTVYAFCRKTDDIADDEVQSIQEKSFRLNEWKRELSKAIETGDSSHSLLNKVGKVIKSFTIPSEYFFELIKGMEMDLKKSRYNTFYELSDYCYKVGSCVGLMCIEIFGYHNPKTKDFAVNLGIALQLTNILRDIKSDAKIGRIYIPLEDLRKYNYTESDLLESKYNDNFIKLMKFECERARFFYDEANKSLSKDDKGLMFPARIMEHIYFRVLKKIEKKNYNIFEGRIGVSKLKKIIISIGIFVKYKLLYDFDEKSLAINGK